MPEHAFFQKIAPRDGFLPNFVKKMPSHTQNAPGFIPSVPRFFPRFPRFFPRFPRFFPRFPRFFPRFPRFFPRFPRFFPRFFFNRFRPFLTLFQQRVLFQPLLGLFQKNAGFGQKSRQGQKKRLSSAFLPQIATPPPEQDGCSANLGILFSGGQAADSDEDESLELLSQASRPALSLRDFRRPTKLASST